MKLKCVGTVERSMKSKFSSNLPYTMLLLDYTLFEPDVENPKKQEKQWISFEDFRLHTFFLATIGSEITVVVDCKISKDGKEYKMIEITDVLDSGGNCYLYQAEEERVTDGLFEFFDESSRFRLKLVIGAFLSHQVPWFDDHGNLLEPDVVNRMSRLSIAERFVEERTHGGKYPIEQNYITIQSFEEHDLLNDIAEFIDLRIPKNYWIRRYEQIHGKSDRSVSSRLYKGIEQVQALKYWYDVNYEREGINQK